MTKKKKTVICISIILCILCITFAGAFIWYTNSPFPTAVKLMKSVKSKDADGILDCIEPDKAKAARLLISLFGMDTNALMDKLIPDGGLGGNGTTKIKLAGYKRDGDTAYITIDIIDKGDNSVNSINVRFVRIDGKWYLAISL